MDKGDNADIYREPEPYGSYLVRRSSEILAEGAVHVVVVGQIPTWTNSLPWVLNWHFLRQGQPLPARTHTDVVPDSLKLDNSMRALPWEPRVNYFSLKDVLCNAQGCMTKVGDNLPDDLMVFDYGHLTRNGALFIMSKGLGSFIIQEIGGG